MTSRPLNIQVRDSVFDPAIPPLPRPKVYVRKSGNNTLYKVWLYLSGYDLPYVQSATYILHPTFSDPIRVVRRNLNNPDCQLIIWTWGTFEIKVKIEDKSGRYYEVVHRLNFDKELKQDFEYIYEEEVQRTMQRSQF